ncbi:yippee zinc-binding/DNA-binding /Mis18, centromere assembly-domain-containing protein [Coniella lustricola]|uniref:Yippee zinc-binding/DNA-binding /Mis18, centromere assembly-domain-containing protein n=1 Tax=Coniella lustricola TaxID=2025994 RepID=A0A2T3AFX5_9PEZI|nr:yippee zinc-binding/DNA-binding /Mis18, centromere assembly-domain-containing protein [Coniella lustricola]
MYRTNPINQAPKAPAAPRFPVYLLPSLKIPFFRRRQSSGTTTSSTADNEVPSLSSSPTSATSADYLSSSPTTDALPDLLRCRTCGTDIAYGLQIVSKSFTGRHGRALLVSPPPATATPSCPSYMAMGHPEPRNLVTGAHVVADINCSTCGVKIGWKYVDARERAQKYKVGKFILETERVVLFRSLEDVHPDDKEAPQQFSGGESGGDVVFDSDDDDECEDIFAGVWDAATVARRRNSRVSNRHPKNGRADR